MTSSMWCLLNARFRASTCTSGDDCPPKRKDAKSPWLCHAGNPPHRPSCRSRWAEVEEASAGSSAGLHRRCRLDALSARRKGRWAIIKSCWPLLGILLGPRYCTTLSHLEHGRSSGEVLLASQSSLPAPELDVRNHPWQYIGRSSCHILVCVYMYNMYIHIDIYIYMYTHVFDQVYHHKFDAPPTYLKTILWATLGIC